MRNDSSFPGALQRWRLYLYNFFGYHHNNIHYAYLAIQAVLDSALEVGIYFNFTEGKFLLNSKRRKCESKNKLIKFLRRDPAIKNLASFSKYRVLIAYGNKSKQDMRREQLFLF